MHAVIIIIVHTVVIIIIVHTLIIIIVHTVIIIICRRREIDYQVKERNLDLLVNKREEKAVGRISRMLSRKLN